MDSPLLIVVGVLLVVLLAAVLVVLLRRRPEISSPQLSDELARELMAKLAASSAEPGSAGGGASVDVAAAEAQAAEVRRAAQRAADRQVAEASAAAEELRSAAAAQADSTRRTAREDAARQRTELNADLDRIRADAQAEGRRSAESSLASARAELEEAKAAQVAAKEMSARLAEEAKRNEAERLEVVTARAAADAAQRSAHDQLAAAQQQVGELATRVAELDQRAAALDDSAAQQVRELERIAGMTADEAKTGLLARMEEQTRREAAIAGRRIEAEAEASAKQRARAIVADAVQRVASDQTAQSVVSVVHLPADEIKGRIIGREGRNIRAFETVTGVNVIIDDTPEAVLLSCFDPVRRETGRVTLLSLIEDGRIHPHRIEEAYERAKDEVAAQCRRAAEDALIEVGIGELHPELMTLLGHLKFRSSYGQNVLGHMVETVHIARGIAYELGVDPTVLVRGAFLHDIGKALTHESQGSHAIVGAELARRYGESDEVAHCIEAHHDEVAPSTVEAVLTQAADACSGGRPGARRESLESYVQRMERIEAIAGAKKGVEKVFAMQAGRELRVMVKPDLVDDLEAHLIAREVAKQIEEELTYPGQVRVTVIRESRATEIAR